MTKVLGKVLLVLPVLALAIAAAAQGRLKQKPWTEWTQREAEEILNESAWGQTETQTETEQSMMRTDLLRVNLRVRLLSAKPIRQAFFRILQLSRASSQQLDQAMAFVEGKYPQTIVVAVNYDGSDSALIGPIMQALSGALTSVIKGNTYLEPKGGERVFLQEYQPPSQDQLGAKFIFPRFVDDLPFIGTKTDWVRFYTELPKAAGAGRPASFTTPSGRMEAQKLTINVRFKVRDLMYDGVLEY